MTFPADDGPASGAAWPKTPALSWATCGPPLHGGLDHPDDVVLHRDVGRDGAGGPAVLLDQLDGLGELGGAASGHHDGGPFAGEGLRGGAAHAGAAAGDEDDLALALALALATTVNPPITGTIGQ